ncbi:MAG: AEC family transporter [Caulobacteraceae bacterium]|nr:AEC family transporter [Caulobacteraceae bacterium]
MDLLARIAPFFLLIGLGAAAGRLKLLDEGGWRGLSAYTFWIGFPALLVSWLGGAPAPSRGLWTSVALYVGVLAAIMALAWAVGAALRWRPAERAGAGACAGVGNTAFLGAPIVVALLGESARGPAMAFVAADFSLLTTLVALGFLRAGPGRASGRARLAAVVNPTVVGAGVGVALSLTGARLWTPVGTAVDLLAATASPVALVALGGLIGAQRLLPDRREAGPLTLALGLKLAAAPLLVWAVFHWGLPGGAEAATVAVMLAGCPTAVNVFVQARAFGVFEAGAARAVGLGAVLSLFTLTLIAGWLGH